MMANEPVHANNQIKVISPGLLSPTQIMAISASHQIKLQHSNQEKQPEGKKTNK